MLGRGSQGVSVQEAMWCMGGHHASLDRDMFSLCVVGRKGEGASLECTTKGSAWPQDGGRHWKRTGKKLPEAMTNIIIDSTCGRRQHVPGRRCSTKLTPPPGTHNSQRTGTSTFPIVQIRKLRHGEAPRYTALGPVASAAGTPVTPAVLMEGVGVPGRGSPHTCLPAACFLGPEL